MEFAHACYGESGGFSLCLLIGVSIIIKPCFFKAGCVLLWLQCCAGAFAVVFYGNWLGTEAAIKVGTVCHTRVLACVAWP